MATQNNIIPFEATHPGILIKDELDVREDINQKELAKKMGVKPSFLNEIIKGKRPLTADYAIVLEKILDIPADYWMRFQTQYEIDKARVREKNIEKIKNIEIWDTIKKHVPVKYFRKNMYLTGSLKEDILSVMNIYKISSIDELVNSATKNNLAFFRKSDRLQIDKKNMLAWSSLAIYEAEKQNINVFNKENIDQLCIQLNQIFYKNNMTIDNVRIILNQYGIKFVNIPKLEKTPIDGYSFWSGNNPCIALTLRHNRIDNFAFTLMHELGHIALHLANDRNAEFVDIYQEKHVETAEMEADNFAQKKIIPDIVWSEISENHFPIDDEKIIILGSKYDINPAILFGRICFEMNKYSYKTKINKKLN